MSKLFQIRLSNGNIYITREDNIDEFHKSKVYKLKKGCVIKGIMSQNGQQGTQLFDLSLDTFFDLPIVIQSNCIVEVMAVKRMSKLEKLYLQVTSGIIIAKESGTC